MTIGEGAVATPLIGLKGQLLSTETAQIAGGVSALLQDLRASGVGVVLRCCRVCSPLCQRAILSSPVPQRSP